MLIELRGVSVEACLLSPRHMQPGKKFLKSEPCRLQIGSPGWWQSPIDRVEPGGMLATPDREKGAM